MRRRQSKPPRQAATQASSWSLLLGAVCFERGEIHLCSLSTDLAGQLNVLGHDGDALGVDGAQVGVFKQTNKVSLASFLKSHDSGALETQIGLEIQSDFSHKALEGQLADQQLSGSGNDGSHEERLYQACNDEVS